MNGSTERRSVAHAKGFTLTEAVVVVALIVLVGIAGLAAAQQAGQSAQSIQCQANLNRLSDAMHLYADTENDKFFHRGNGFYGPWFTNTKLRGLLGVDENLHAEQLPADLLCPSRPQRTAEEDAWFVYGQNASDVPEIRMEDGTVTVVIERNRVTQPSQRVHLVDATDWNVMYYGADSAQFWDQHGDKCGRQGAPWNGVAYRHDQTANVARFDGSVQVYTKDQLYPRNQQGLSDQTALQDLWWVYPLDQ